MSTKQIIINSLISGDRSWLNIILLGSGISVGIVIFRAIKDYKQTQKVDWMKVFRATISLAAFGLIVIARLDQDLSSLGVYLKFVFIPIIIGFSIFYYIKVAFPAMGFNVEEFKDIYPWMVIPVKIAVHAIILGFGIMLLLYLWELLMSISRI